MPFMDDGESVTKDNVIQLDSLRVRQEGCQCISEEQAFLLSG